MITQYILEEKFFVVIVYNLLEQQTYINECLNINGKQKSKMSKKVNLLHLKIIKGK